MSFSKSLAKHASPKQLLSTAAAKPLSGMAKDAIKAMPKRPNYADIKNVPAPTPKKKGFLGGMFGF